MHGQGLVTVVCYRVSATYLAPLHPDMTESNIADELSGQVVSLRSGRQRENKYL